MSSWGLQTATEGSSAFSSTVLESWRQVPLRMERAVVRDCTTSDILHTLGPGTLLSSVASPVDPAFNGSKDLHTIFFNVNLSLFMNVI